MEQAGCAGGDQPSGPGAGEGGRADTRLCGACGSGLVSRALGRLRDPPWGHYGPCARCSLETRPDRRGKRGPELRQSQRLCREPRWSAARRACHARHAPRLASVATKVRLAALRSPHGEETERGAGPRRHKGRRSVGWRALPCINASPLPILAAGTWGHIRCSFPGDTSWLHQQARRPCSPRRAALARKIIPTTRSA